MIYDRSHRLAIIFVTVKVWGEKNRLLLKRPGAAPIFDTTVPAAQERKPLYDPVRRHTRPRFTLSGFHAVSTGIVEQLASLSLRPQECFRTGREQITTNKFIQGDAT